MWSSSAGGGRPFPYIRVARFNQNTFDLIDEPDIWSNSVAWIYNAVAINDRGDIGGVVFWGGGGNYPQMANIIWDGFSPPPPPWETHLAVASAKGATNWGRNGGSGSGP